MEQCTGTGNIKFLLLNWKLFYSLFISIRVYLNTYNDCETSHKEIDFKPGSIITLGEDSILWHVVTLAFNKLISLTDNLTVVSWPLPVCVLWWCCGWMFVNDTWSPNGNNPVQRSIYPVCYTLAGTKSGTNCGSKYLR